MEFRVLGPLEASSEGRLLDLGGAKQRALLAVLLLEANSVVSTGRLTEALWEDDPPETAQKALQVHVSEIGAPHLVDPSRLERSARRLYGDEFDSLWGELAPVPEANVHAVGANVLGLECFPAPGHASHHVAYLDAGGTLYAGDA